MNNLLYVLWNPSPDMMHIGPLTLHWYSMCWLVGLLGAYLLMKRLYKEQYIKDELFDPLFLYCFMGILIGARLGHCLFYQPDYFLSSGKHIVEMLLPIHFMEDGGWRFTGYEGLASHGGTLGLMIALWLYCRKTKLGIWHVLDDIAIVTPITACFIRLGNLMNSEIIGKVLSSSRRWTQRHAIPDNSTRPSPMPCSLSSAMPFIASTPKRWAQVSISASASPTSSQPASSLSSPRTYRWPSKPRSHSTWDNCSACHSLPWA